MGPKIHIYSKPRVWTTRVSLVYFEFFPTLFPASKSKIAEKLKPIFLGFKVKTTVTRSLHKIKHFQFSRKMRSNKQNLLKYHLGDQM